MIKFFVKFLLFFGFLFFGFFFIFFCYLMSEKQNNPSGDWYVLFICGGISVIFFWLFESEGKEPEEPPKTVTNIDKPKESDDVIVVTEIQGERKIIKNGKVIYSEKLKADELKVFENLKDKN